MRWGNKTGFGAVLSPAVNIQENKVKKALKMVSSNKVATSNLNLSDGVTPAAGYPCFSTPILEAALHNLLPRPHFPPWPL